MRISTKALFDNVLNPRQCEAGNGKCQPRPFILCIGNARLVNRYH